MYICEVRLAKTKRLIGKVELPAMPLYSEKLSIPTRLDELFILDIQHIRTRGDVKELVLEVCSVNDFRTWEDYMSQEVIYDEGSDYFEDTRRYESEEV